jgi:hypothetical protein
MKSPTFKYVGLFFEEKSLKRIVIRNPTIKEKPLFKWK